MVDTRDSLEGRGRSLEEEFFHREDQRLIARLRALKETETAREALAKATGITNSDVLDKLAALGIKPETVVALSLVPLVEVAWADGSLDDKERRSVMASARESGLGPDSAEHALLEAWLQRRPEPRLLLAWTHLVQGMREKLDSKEVVALRSKLIERARLVARASGGTLGLGSKVSHAEEEMLQRLDRAFNAPT